MPTHHSKAAGIHFSGSQNHATNSLFNITLPMPQSSLITATFISINPIMILPQHPFSLLLIQLAVILLVSHFFGMLAKRMNQPVVIGEMIAGIFMGPSIVGVLLPGFQQAFFPAGSISVLEFFSQMGLLLFMFTV
ncbi:MAG TPA: cation:proton antiporter, partial [Chitinophaga sp.]|uniref:cation:proton antiporter domain-containing protein n=1 Tax=Chitinophaga sp. TaxID=1869181 RepID=UPI002C83B68B